jgi:hypothetical protein
VHENVCQRHVILPQLLPTIDALRKPFSVALIASTRVPRLSLMYLKFLCGRLNMRI